MSVPKQFNLEVIEKIDSTNTCLKDRVQRDHIGSWHALRAKEQTGAYGQKGRRWESLKGNLFLSFTVPTYEFPHNNYYPFLAAVALGKTLEGYHFPTEFLFKWPNDLFIEQKKCAGFLIEQIDTVNVIGVGVNIVSAPKVEQPTTYLNKYIQTSAEDFASHYLKNFLECYRLWYEEGFSHLKDLWVAKAMYLNEEITTPQGKGTFVGIADDGAMLIENAKKTTKIYSTPW